MKVPFFLSLLAVLVLLAVQAAALNWAVIVAGSTGWGNYRHQADACHAKKLAFRNGIPASRIITFVFDDLAQNSNNPFPGKVFNKPDASGSGVDVYAGCIAQGDYTGNDVTADHFLAAITGNVNAVPPGKKVLHSSGSDNVFINFIDHGAVGIIAFPDRLLSNKELLEALNTMKTKGMYDKLVFYLESCESGSMFAGLLDPSLNIYATTASAPDESSWGTYCPPDDVIHGTELNTCLGDLYEVNWMQNLESAGKTETLEQQYNYVKVATNLSAVEQYGDLSWTDLEIGNFIGDKSARYPVHIKPENNAPPSLSSSIKSRDIPLHLAYYKYLRSDLTDFVERQKLGQELKQEVEKRMFFDTLFMDLSTELTGDTQLLTKAPSLPVLCGDCCEAVNEAFKVYCGGYDDYNMQFSKVLYNLCEVVEMKLIVDNLKKLCGNQ